MKKIFFAVALAATLVSCGHKTELYFAEFENKTVNNPEAEFDTLSYAMGMNYALYFQLKAPELQYDNELMAQTFVETMEKGITSFESTLQLQKRFGEYQKSHLAEYQKAMQKRMFMKDAEIEIPEIYDEEFTNTMFTSMLSRINAAMLLTHNTPYNAHYIAQAIRDSKNVEADSLINSVMKITTEQMMKSIQQNQRIDIQKNIKAQVDTWLADIATRPDVQALDVNGETIYYRINSNGGIKPEARDSIVASYALYTYRGRLVESTATRIQGIKETIELIKEDKEISDSTRNARIKLARVELEKAKSQKLVLDQFRIAAIKHCLPLIGECGSITIWASSKFAPRSQSIMAGEGVVMNVELHKVVKGVNTPVITPAQPMVPKGMGGKVSIEGKEHNGRVITPSKITPVGPKQGAKPENK